MTQKNLSLYKEITLGERVVPDFILGEFETFIMHVAPSRFKLNPEDKQKLKQLAFDYIHRITNQATLVAPEVKTVQRARDIYFENAHSHYISFVDSLILATTEQNNYILFSRDVRLNTLAQKLNIQLLGPQDQ